MRVALLATTVLVSACSGTSGFDSFANFLDGPRPETVETAVDLPPVTQSGANDLASFTVTSLIDGSTGTFAIQPHGSGIRARQDNGCDWTRSSWFAPSDSWTNCGTSTNWHSAQATVRVLDPLFPLTVGSTGTFERAATSVTGRTQLRRTTCEVTGIEVVIRPGQTDMPAYVVVCDDTRRERTTWYAPDQGPVAFLQVSAQGDVEEAWIRTE